MKKFKRLYSYALIFAIILSILTPTNTTINAATEIDYIYLEISNPLVDNNGTVEYYIEDDSNFSVSGTPTWKDSLGNPVDNIAHNETYYTTIEIVPDDGYEFTSNPEEYNMSYISSSYSANSIVYEFECVGSKLIDTITLPNAPQYIIGNPINQYSYTCTEYTSVGTWHIYNYHNKEFDEINSSLTFTSNDIYWLELYFSPQTGYIFDEELEITVSETNYNYDSENYWSDSEYANIHMYFSDTTEITEIDIDAINFPEPVVGETFQNTYINISAPTGSNYSVTGQWYEEESNEYSGTFELGKSYTFYYDISPNEGYCFADSINIIENNNTYTNSAYDKCSYSSSYRKSFKTVIDEVKLLNLPEAELGASLQLGTLNISVPNGANYTAEARWLDDNDNEITDNIVKIGSKYTLNITITPKSGCEFNNDNLPLYIDNSEYQNNESNSYFNYFNDSADFYKTYSFYTVIDEVELLNLPKAELGGSLQLGSFNVPVPAGADYTAEAIWLDGNDDPITTTTVEDKNKYTLDITLTPNTGCEFNNDLTFITDNGTENRYANNYEAYYDVTYSFLDDIDNISVTHSATPQIGDAVTIPQVTIPTDANYHIDSVRWDDEDNLTDSDFYTPPTTFEEGHSYRLSIELCPNDGYEFDYLPGLLVNNKLMDYSTATGIEDSYYYATPDRLQIHLIFSFKETISEIRIDNVPEMEIGNTATTDGITIPTNANYIISSAEWLEWDNTNGYDTFDGIFESEKVYNLYIYVKPKTGYQFDSNKTAFYINGKTNSNANIYSSSYASYDIEYSEGFKIIEKIDLTIDKPNIGQSSSTYPKINIEGDANYKIYDEDSAWMIGNEDFYDWFYGTFESDKDYGVEFYIEANDGYIFSEDLIIIVNDKIISTDDTIIYQKNNWLMYFFNSECAHITSAWEKNTDNKTHSRQCVGCGHEEKENHTFSDWTTNADGTRSRTCSVCGAVDIEKISDNTQNNSNNNSNNNNTTESTTAPPTSDESNPILLMIIVILSGSCLVGFAILNKKKKTTN